MSFNHPYFFTGMTRFLLGLLLTTLAGSLVAKPLSSLSHIHGIAVPQNQPEGLYLATHNGFYMAMSNGTAKLVSPITDDFMSLVTDPSDPDTFYASGHPRGGGNLGLLKTTDGGRSWTQISKGLNGPVDYHALTISPADPQRIYGMYGGLQISHDGGESWRMGNLPKGVTALAGSSINADTLYAATKQGLKLSKDGGERWRSAMMMRRPASVIHVTPDGYAYTFLAGKGLLKVKEPGLGWKVVFNGFGKAIPVQMTSDLQNPNRLFVLDNQGHLWKSTDAGVTWQPFS